MAAGGSTKAIVAAFFANLGIALAKLVGFFVTGASSMLAESVHSFADSGNQGLLLWGGRAAKKAPDEEHQFGYSRERYFWSFVVSLVLFTLGSLFATFEGIEKIRHPHELESIGVAIGILIFGILIEGWSFRTAVVEARPVKGNATWVSFIRHSRTPELPVVLLEDLGALVGLCLALGAIGMAQITGDPIWDGIGTLSIGILLGVIAIILAIEMRSLLLGEGATKADMKKIRAAIESTPKVQHLIHIRTQHLGPEDLLVACKVHFDEGLSVSELADAINAVEQRVRAQVPYARPMYIEPDIRRQVAEA
ncbi:MAG: cation diffusion facilitator family transporter [Acidimicrobiales bacterium]